MAKKTASISVDTYTDLLEALKPIDAQLTAAAGTISKRRTDSLESIKVSETSLIEAFEGDLEDGVDRPYLVVWNLARATERLELAKSAFADAKNAVDEAVTLKIRSAKNETESDSLKVARIALTVKLDSVRTVLEMMGVDVDSLPEVPNAPKGSSHSGSTSTTPRVARSGSSSKANYSYSADGIKWTVPCEAQNSLSSIASRKFDHAPTADVQAALLAAGVESLTKPYEARITVNGKTVTVKMEAGVEATPTTAPVEEVPAS